MRHHFSHGYQGNIRCIAFTRRNGQYGAGGSSLRRCFHFSKLLCFQKMINSCTGHCAFTLMGFSLCDVQFLYYISESKYFHTAPCCKGFLNWNTLQAKSKKASFIISPGQIPWCCNEANFVMPGFEVLFIEGLCIFQRYLSITLEYEIYQTFIFLKIN